LKVSMKRFKNRWFIYIICIWNFPSSSKTIFINN
jgi:hypothetical protein